MKEKTITIDRFEIPLYSMNTLIIGSGTAALNAAGQLHELGQKDICIVTDQWGGGTSNNTGSDKQTYYKLSISGEEPDSPMDMARDLFNGGCMHGDIALVEAQNSLQAFFQLVKLGVPFPHDRFGGFVGYKTDHDPRQRATSAGPLTSQKMFQALAADIEKKDIPVLDGHQVIALLTDGSGEEKRVIGALALDMNRFEEDHLGLVVFNAVNIVLGTGGPAGIYKTSVYPESQLGACGLAFEIGAIGQNLTEWQYGLASTKFRWNLSGTYQQVIPRYFSTNPDGGDEKDFLNAYFPDMGNLATAIFLKGYQWPFDPKKVMNYGSSLIDVLVYHETVTLGRRVFLDYGQNPNGNNELTDFQLDQLNDEAYRYLEKSGALLKTPIQRLQKMNQPAIDLYKDHDIDLTREALEIAVCAQHNNGGLKGNIWWESNIKHLFPVGEVNGTHGVYRPGGSALNSGQVGSLRAAQFISRRYGCDPMDASQFKTLSDDQIRELIQKTSNMVRQQDKKYVRLDSVRDEIQSRMTTSGAHIRSLKNIRKARDEAWQQYQELKNHPPGVAKEQLPDAFRNLDLCLTHALYLESMLAYLEKGGKSRGSIMVLDPGGNPPCDSLEKEWCFAMNEVDAFVDNKILEIRMADHGVHTEWVDIRPIPEDIGWFEIVWNDFRNDKIIG